MNDNFHTENPNTALIKEVAAEQLAQAIRISTLENKIEDQIKDIKILRDGMTRLLTIVENDEKTGSKGIVSQVRDNTEQIEKIEDGRRDLKTQIKAFGVFVTALAGVITWALNIYFQAKNN